MEMNRKGLVCSKFFVYFGQGVGNFAFFLILGGRLDPALFEMQPKASKLVLEGGNVTLRCIVSTMKDSETLEWLHDGKPIISSELHEANAYFLDGGRFHVTELRITEFGVSKSFFIKA